MRVRPDKSERRTHLDPKLGMLNDGIDEGGLRIILPTPMKPIPAKMPVAIKKFRFS
jgi:hypothetical protein